MTTTFIAVRVHDSAGGMLPTDYKELSGTTREELVSDAYVGLAPGYYPARIVAKGSSEALWTEHSGWTEAANQVVPD